MGKVKRGVDSRVAAIAAAALLIAQFGAMTHGYSHVPQLRAGTAGPAVSLEPTLAAQPAVSHQPADAAQPAAPGHDACGDCLNFAPLLSAAGTPTQLPFFADAGRSVARPAPLDSLVDLRPRLAFRSRAPPVTP